MILESLNKDLDGCKNIVIFTGAGISTLSGIPDFKSFDIQCGLGVNREIVLNINYLEREPELFWVYFEQIFDFNLLEKKEPNYVHDWVKSLEEKYNVTVITQNIDNLHQKAGSTNVIDLHGSIGKYYCLECGKEYSQEEVNKQLEYISELDTYKLKYQAPKCSCKNVLKPDIVLYGESVNRLTKAKNTVKEADAMVVLGSSLEVAPANTLLLDFYKNKRQHPIKLIIVNKDKTSFDRYADIHYRTKL